MNTEKQSAHPQQTAKQASSACVSPPIAPLALLNRRFGNEGMRGILQAKLSVSDPHDSFEQEADRVADQVMRTPDARSVARSPLQIQRVCSECEEDLHRSEESSGTTPTVSASTETSIASLSSRGSALPDSVRSFMEPRFKADFSAVRVHADAHAHDLARSVNAQAFTVGNNVVFGAGHYSPDSDRGKRLLAHELTHVVQQTGPGASGNPSTLARFSDTGHHIVEEAGLAGAGFTKEQIESVEHGNVHRDYSQIGEGLKGKIGNAALLCRPSNFGGYRPVEHFDNYMWDAVTGGWRRRGGSAFVEAGVDVKQTPIDYIAEQLEELANRGNTEAGLEHLGNAFHTVEDFFAHSNFVELVQKDFSHGSTLMTGNPVGPSDSVPRIFEAISPKGGSSEFYRGQAEEAIANALPGSHTQLAHDEPNTANYTIARRLAALVIQDLGSEVLAVMTVPQPQRSQLMRERVVSKAIRYLRPPDAQDKWWESLKSKDAGAIDKRLREAALRTPTEVNQCVLSPLKNIEASRNAGMALPVGVVFHAVVGNSQLWIQGGAGVTRPIPFERLPGDAIGGAQEKSSPVVGVQIGGSF